MEKCRHEEFMNLEEIEKGSFDKSGNEVDPYSNPGENHTFLAEAVFEIKRCKTCGAIFSKKFKEFKRTVPSYVTVDDNYWKKFEFEFSLEEISESMAIPLDPLVIKYPDIFYQNIIKEGGVYGGGFQLGFDKDNYAVSSFFVEVRYKKYLPYGKPIKQYPITLPGIKSLQKAYTFDNSKEFLKEMKIEEDCKHERFGTKAEFETAFFNNGLEVGHNTPKYTSSCRFLNLVCKDCGKILSSRVDAIYAGTKSPDPLDNAEWKANKEYWYSLEFDNMKKEGKE